MPWQFAFLACASFAAAAVNAIAGGGSFLTFPSLTGVIGLSERAANMTNTMSSWTGWASSIYAVTDQIRALPRGLLTLFCIVSVFAGAAGALLLQSTRDASFALILPWLLLAATMLFAFSKPIARWAGRGHGSVHSTGWTALVAGSVFLVGVYAGYFGAGSGVLFLAGLSFVGLEDIHQVNALKSVLATIVNLVAAIFFCFSGQVSWSAAGVMIPAAVAGGFTGMKLARRIPEAALRAAILAVGAGLTVVYFARNYHVHVR